MEVKTREKSLRKKESGRHERIPTKTDAISVNSAWSETEDEKLREIFPFSSDEELVLAFKRSATSIKGRAYRLGIKKHWSMVQSIHKRNAKSRWNQLREEKHAAASKNVIRTGKKAIIVK
jgi:hypothetical protein